MKRQRGVPEPTLGEAWTTLGERLGLEVEVRGDRSIHAEGTIRGRTVTVEIDGSAARSEFARFFFGLNTISSRNRREKWHTVVSVGCSRGGGQTGVIESAVDVHDPAWNPREYNPRNGRKIRTDPASLADLVLTDETRQALMSIADDVQIHVEPTAIRIDDHSTALPDSGATYVAGSLIHHYTGPIEPWPERALVGPPRWISLLCDLADTYER